MDAGIVLPSLRFDVVAFQTGEIWDRQFEVLERSRVHIQYGPVGMVRGQEMYRQRKGTSALLLHEAYGLVGEEVGERALELFLLAIDLENRVNGLRGMKPAVEVAKAVAGGMELRLGA